jgi:hypothetical protein
MTFFGKKSCCHPQSMKKRKNMLKRGPEKKVKKFLVLLHAKEHIKTPKP